MFFIYPKDMPRPQVSVYLPTPVRAAYQFAAPYQEPATNSPQRTEPAQKTESIDAKNSEISELKQKVDELETQVAQYQNRYSLLENQLAQTDHNHRQTAFHDAPQPSPANPVLYHPSTQSSGLSLKASDTRQPPSPPSSEDEMKQVLLSLEKWRAAWQSQDIESYIAQYTYDFRAAPGKSRSAWVAERKIKLNQPQTISIKIDRIRLSRLAHQRWAVTFRQRYQSDIYQDVVTKTLTLRKVGNQYLIDGERSTS